MKFSTLEALTLYATTGQQEQARAALTTAIDLYRAMDMTFWLPQAEAALAQVEGREWTMVSFRQWCLCSSSRRPATNIVRALPKRRAKESFAEHIPTMLVVCIYNPLSMKSFHGVSAGNVHKCLPKTSIGKVSGLLFTNNDLSGGAGHAVRLSSLDLVLGPSSDVAFHQNNFEDYALT